MMTGDDNSVFLDTNILVYANVSESVFHQAALQAIQIKLSFLRVLCGSLFVKECVSPEKFRFILIDILH